MKIPNFHRTIQKYRENFPDGPLPAHLFIPREHIDNWISALSLRLNTFYAHYIWVPQHITALTILCLGCYLYLNVRNRRKLLVAISAGIAARGIPAGDWTGPFGDRDLFLPVCVFRALYAGCNCA